MQRIQVLLVCVMAAPEVYQAWNEGLLGSMNPGGCSALEGAEGDIVRLSGGRFSTGRFAVPLGV